MNQFDVFANVFTLFIFALGIFIFWGRLINKSEEVPFNYEQSSRRKIKQCDNKTNEEYLWRKLGELLGKNGISIEEFIQAIEDKEILEYISDRNKSDD